MSLNRNTAANLVGRVWAAGLGVVLIPVYIHLMGMESYALVGIFGTLQALFTFIDFGLGATYSREVARLSALQGKEQEQRDLLLTFSIVYWILAAIVATAIWFLAPPIATKWVHAQRLSADAIIMSIRLMGVAIALQFPTGLFQGGLLGLQKQVEYNIILISTTTVRGLGMIFVLWFISPTVQCFFIWQALLTCVAVVANWVALNNALPAAASPANVRLPLVSGLWQYAAGWMGNTIGIAFAQQFDKVILSKTLVLEQFGYYALAGNVAVFLWTLVYSVTAAVFPRFNQYVAVDDQPGLADEYARANQLLATIIVPVSAVTIFFARDLMTLWTRKPAVAAATAPLVMLFALGMTLIGLVNVALNVALSYGWFRLTSGFIWGTAIASAPLFWICSRLWGTVGAAGVWCAQNAAYLLLIPILHRRYIRGGGMTWLRQTLIFPGAVAAVICGTARMIAPSISHPVLLVAVLLATWAATTAAIAVIEPTIRVQVVALYARMRTTPRAA